MKRLPKPYLCCLAILLAVAASASFMMSRSTAAPDRPQTPAAPLPYAVEQIVFSPAGQGLRLSGTLTLPPGAGPHPAIVLVPARAKWTVTAPCSATGSTWCWPTT